MQLEEAEELLSEEELWYVLCEMAQVRLMGNTPTSLKVTQGCVPLMP